MRSASRNAVRQVLKEAGEHDRFFDLCDGERLDDCARLRNGPLGDRSADLCGPPKTETLNMLTETSNLSVKAAARRLGISVSKLYQLAAARRIAFYRIGGKIVFSNADVEAFMQSCRVGVAVSQPATPRIRVKLRHLRLR